MASFAIKVTRLALRCVSAFSPETAGRLAFRAVQRHAVAETEERQGKGSACCGRTRHGKGAAGHAVFCRRLGHGQTLRSAACYGGATKRILLVHGWGSRSDYLAAMIDGLMAGGAEVVALDWPGHGASPGRTLTMPAAVRAIDAAWRHFGGFDVAVGHSFGGASLACAARWCWSATCHRMLPKEWC